MGYKIIEGLAAFLGVPPTDVVFGGIIFLLALATVYGLWSRSKTRYL